MDVHLYAIDLRIYNMFIRKHTAPRCVYLIKSGWDDGNSITQSQKKKNYN